MLQYMKKGDSEPMDNSFKVKNNLQVGKDAYISGDLFVSGTIVQGQLPIIDGGTPSISEYSNIGDNNVN